MKKIYVILMILLVCIVSLHSQSPTTLNYQGVLKHADGSVRPNATAVLTLEFLQDEMVVYSEVHHVTTNANGYFTLAPGAGEALTGSFDGIDWGNGGIAMRTVLDGEVIALTQLTAVPYALYAIESKRDKPLEQAIDSLSEIQFSALLQIDDIIVSADSMASALQATSQRLESIASSTDSIAGVQNKALVRIDELIITTDSLIIVQKATQSLIDSLLVDNDNTTHRIDELHVATDSLFTLHKHTQLLIDTLRNDADTAALRIDELYGSTLSLGTRIDTIDGKIETALSDIHAMTKDVTFFNATTNALPTTGKFHSRATAIQSVPLSMRHEGLVVTYRTDSLNWISIQYQHSDTTQWNNESAWHSYGTFGNLVIPYHENDSLTRLSVPVEYRRQGAIISYFKDEDVVNEQYIAKICDNLTWSNDSSWMRLNITHKELDKLYQAIADIDSDVKEVKKGLQEMSTFGSWFYIDHSDKFNQAGCINNAGERVANYDMVCTTLLPINNLWYISTYGSKEIPGISFYSKEDVRSRIATKHDNLPSEVFVPQILDFTTAEIPQGAQYFSVNMHLDYKSSTCLKMRTPITDVIDTSEKFCYKESGYSFNYIGAYVNTKGTRVLLSDYRHTGFTPIEGNHHKVIAKGLYTEERTVPLVAYYSEPSFKSCVGYDLGKVQDDRTTSSELIITSETAPKNAKYFIVNCKPAEFHGIIHIGNNNEEMILNADSRLSTLESNQSCYTDRKLVTLGDSFTTNSGNRSKKWQQWLVDWLGLSWSNEETNDGLNNHAPMGYGGSWIMPNDINSLSIRCRDVQQYSPNIIIVYGGQNDKIEKYPLGTIDDEPFIPSQVLDFVKNAPNVHSLSEAISYIDANAIEIKDKTMMHVTTQWGNQLYYLPDSAQWTDTQAWVYPMDTVTFYSAYKGMVEYLSRNSPYATIYCMTLMQCDKSRYDNSLGDWEELNEYRRIKCKAIEEIAQLYGVQVIDLWNKSGVNPYNAASLYTDWLHPNQYGYRKLAECVYKHLK